MWGKCEKKQNLIEPEVEQTTLEFPNKTLHACIYIYYLSLLVLKAASASVSTNHLQVVWETEAVSCSPFTGCSAMQTHIQEAFHAAVDSETP